jgi:hypothetical protein
LTEDIKSKINPFRNNELHATLLELVNKTIQQLSEGLNLQTETRGLYNKIKTMEEPLRQYDKTSLLHEDLILNEMMDYFVDSRKELLTSLQEYSICVSVMDKDETISKQINKSHRLLGHIQYITHWSYISHILKTMVRSYLRYEEINRQKYDSLYSDLEQFFYNERIKLVEICPLLNFDIINYPDPIILSDCLSLRRVDNEQRSLLAEKLAFLGIGIDDIIKIKYVLEYSFSLSKGFDISPEIQDKEYPSHLNSLFASVITALRLYKEGAVGTNMLLQIVMLDLPIRMSKILLGLPILGMETRPGIDYNMNETEVREFNSFWNKYNVQLLNLLDFKNTKGDQYRNIKTALSRFNSAYDKRNLEDKIIDWVISFESLFSKKDDPTDSITHKLALRSSRFSKPPLERKDLYNRFKEVYGARSKIVHGASWERPKMDIRSHLSQCIIKYLDELLLHHSHVSILGSIDFD